MLFLGYSSFSINTSFLWNQDIFLSFFREKHIFQFRYMWFRRLQWIYERKTDSYRRYGSDEVRRSSNNIGYADFFSFMGDHFANMQIWIGVMPI